MATHRRSRSGADPRLTAHGQRRRYERELRAQLAGSQIASFFHLLCSEFKLGWLSRSVILTYVALRRTWLARRASRRAAR